MKRHPSIERHPLLGDRQTTAPVRGDGPGNRPATRRAAGRTVLARGAGVAVTPAVATGS